jgi:hypothetical protein
MRLGLVRGHAALGGVDDNTSVYYLPNSQTDGKRDAALFGIIPWKRRSGMILCAQSNGFLPFQCTRLVQDLDDNAELPATD